MNAIPKTQMKAAVYRRYGAPEVLEIGHVERPSPEGDEILVEVVASSLNAGDHHLMRGTPFPIRLMFGLLAPKQPILGADVAGRVVAVGPDVTEFSPGDEVVGDLANHGFGGHAEFVAAPASSFAKKPSSASFEEAASLPTAAVTALQGLRNHGKLAAGERVLIHGASGGVGHFAVQIAKALGAHVTAVTSKVEFARELGADEVIDYRSEDFAASGQKWDLILAAGGNRTMADYASALKPGGRFVHAGGSMTQLMKVSLFGRWYAKEGRTLTAYLAAPNTKDLAHLCDLVDAGKVRPAIEQTHPLEELAQAMTHFESGRVRGKIAITR